MTETSALNFDDFCELLLPLGAISSPSELHGFLCGKLCGGAILTVEEWQQVAWELLDMIERPDPDTQGLIAALYETTQEQLASGDYDLQPFLPDDDTDLEQRTQALSQWCHGFLTGFGSAGIDPNAQFSSDQADSLRDLANIVQATVEEEGAEGEEDQEHLEANYLELVEYVRIVALNFYEDNRPDSRPQLSTEASPSSKLH